MALATKETIDKLKSNSAAFLTECEPLLRTVSELRTKLEQVKSNTNKEFDTAELVIQNTIDLMLCDCQILFDAVSSLRFLLNSEDVYAKRFAMQCINLCFCESVRFWKQVGKKCNGPLIQLRNLSKEIQLFGHHRLFCHILDDINEFESDYLKKDLRDSFRHRSDIQKLYRHQLTLDNEDFYAKGVCELMDICLQLSVVCTQLLGLSFKVEKASRDKMPANVYATKNILFLNSFSNEGLIIKINSAITGCVKNIDSCYECGQMVDKAKVFLPKDSQICKQFRDLVLIRMHANYLAADVLCAVRGFLQAKNDFERAQNLRIIYIAKQACLTQLYGYNDKTRSTSLWKSIVGMNDDFVTRDESINPEEQLSKQTENLEEDCKKSNRSTHYVYNNVFYVPDRIEAIRSLDYEKEIEDALSLIRLCKTINKFTQETVSKKMFEERERLQKTFLELTSLWND